MKKTYIIPTVKTYAVTRKHILVGGSFTYQDAQDASNITGGGDANSNSFDDQETPWYRR